MPTVLIERKRLKKNAGIACVGAVSGLTRKRMMRSEVIERSAASERPKRREVTLGVGERIRGQEKNAKPAEKRRGP